MSYFDYINVVAWLMRGKNESTSIGGLTVSGVGVAGDEVKPERVILDSLNYISHALRKAYRENKIDEIYEAVASVLPSSSVYGEKIVNVIYDPVGKVYYANDGTGWLLVKEGMEYELSPMIGGAFDVVIMELAEQKKGILRLLGRERAEEADHGGQVFFNSRQ